MRTAQITIPSLALTALVLGVTAKAAGPAKVVMDHDKSFADSDTLFIPTCIVKLSYAGKVAVSESGSALDELARGGNANTVKASANYKVLGMDREFTNSVAKAICDDFIAKVRASGFKVTTWEDVKDQDWAQKATARTPDASGFVIDGNYVIAAPSDAQNFKPGIGNNYIAVFQKGGKGVYKEHMTLMVPSFTLDSPQVWGSTEKGVNRIGASVKAMPGMNLMGASAPILTQAGAWGGINLKGYVVSVAENVGEATTEDTTSKAGNAIAKGLGMLSGKGSITGTTANVTLTVNKEAYMAGARSGAGLFTEEVAKALSGVKK